MAVARGLRKGHIESDAAAGAGNVSPNAVKYPLVLFVRVETFVQVFTEEAAALRDTECEGALQITMLIRV